MLVTEAIDRWIAQRRAESYSPYTLRAYELQTGLLVRSIGDMPIEAITLGHLRSYVAGPESEGRKASTVAHRVRMIGGGMDGLGSASRQAYQL